MAQTSGFWTTSGSPVGHQVSGYTQVHHSKALQIAGGTGKYEGVAVGFLNELEVYSSAGNQVIVKPGGALVDGKWYENTANEVVSIPSSAVGTTRIDVIALRATWASYKVEIVKISGVNSSNPSVPSLTRNSGSTYDIPLANVTVTSGGAITIMDRRALNLSGLSVVALGNTSSLTVGDGKFTYPIPETLAGLRILRGDIALDTASTSGNVVVQVELDGVDVFSTKPTCVPGGGSSYASGGTRGVVSGTKTLLTDSRIRINVDGAGTNAKGLTLHLVLGG
jgi:hypothetical protein